MADVTNKNLVIPGVNQETFYVKQRSYVVDASELGILTSGTHDIISLPKGEMIVKLRGVVLTGAESSGAATVQFKGKFNGTAEAFGNAIGKSDLAAGDVFEIPVTGVKGYDAEYGCVLQIAVGTADLTALKFMLVVETIPALDFLTRG